MKKLTIEDLKCCGNCRYNSVGKELKCLVGNNPKNSYNRCENGWEFDGLNINRRLIIK